MLPAVHRLRKKKDFEQAYNKGTSQHSTFFRVILAKNQQEQTRIGIVISTKTIKRAVERNRKKRQIRSAVAPLVPALPQGRDIVLIAKPQIQKAEMKEISEDVQNIFNTFT